MPLIYRVVTNYQPPFDTINTLAEATLRCRKLDLYRSIITVGNPSFLSLQNIRDYGFARALYESILKKVGIVASNIQSDLVGLRRHPIFDAHVSDEKRIVSYNLGMAFAKFYSEKLLNIPNLVHIEFLKKQSAVTFIQQAGNLRQKEPDLVGQTADGNWHIFEAKGVSSSASQLNGKIAEAKIQVQQVATIHGNLPLTGSACATYIGPDRILTHLVDPPSGDGKRVEINREKFFDTYYAPFLLAEKSLDRPHRRERIDGLDVDFYDLQQANRKLSIGLDREIAELIRDKKYEIPKSITQRLRQYSSSDRAKDQYSVGLDGFVVGYTDH
ncbi:hypothetical protein SBP18_05655 [Rhodoferax ferrireducens]|uniref:hypothetical protein n=1 Tax=Rhodoferax ferrireducens TaxID=192843 RepID=UPI00298E0331|nr:hypothetical protein [Rhodoferax ferrireducens]WPC67998.1 hypothetical protein SBP18_05655 [Rhodoferax ferrireducens]